MNAPRTAEGRDVWDVALRCRRQFDLIAAGGFGSAALVVTGLRFDVVLRMAEAMGVSPAAVAEFLPDIEDGAVKGMNDNLRSHDG